MDLSRRTSVTRNNFFFRFIYPERPTLYFSLCYLAISVCYLIGLISPGQYSCSEDRLLSGLGSPVCGALFAVSYFFACKLSTSLTRFHVSELSHFTASFLILQMYYFALSGAALSWWLVIIMIWGLSIMFEWNIETIEKNGNYIHIFAWSPPAVLTLLATHFETVSSKYQSVEFEPSF